MHLIEYQNLVMGMPLYDDPLLGLATEAGEFIDEFKKSRRPEPYTKPYDRESVVLEAGDVLWYLVRQLGECGITIEEVMEKNVSKLLERHAQSAKIASVK